MNVCVYSNLSTKNGAAPFLSSLSVTRTHYCWRSPRKSPPSRAGGGGGEQEESRRRAERGVAFTAFVSWNWARTHTHPHTHTHTHAHTHAHTHGGAGASSYNLQLIFRLVPPPFLFLSFLFPAGCARGKMLRSRKERQITAEVSLSFLIFFLFFWRGRKEGWRREMRLNRCRYGGEEFWPSNPRDSSSPLSPDDPETCCLSVCCL